LTEHSDGSFVFTFENASELKEKIAELKKQKLVIDLEGVDERSVNFFLYGTVLNVFWYR
jgi:5-formaminoimidazole-4-carboxamide-1-beta-D-ribofuranosyl 5'-monophosphate synthetase